MTDRAAVKVDVNKMGEVGGNKTRGQGVDRFFICILTASSTVEFFLSRPAVLSLYLSMSGVFMCTGSATGAPPPHHPHYAN